MRKRMMNSATRTLVRTLSGEDMIWNKRRKSEGGLNKTKVTN